MTTIPTTVPEGGRTTTTPTTVPKGGRTTTMPTTAIENENEPCKPGKYSFEQCPSPGNVLRCINNKCIKTDKGVEINHVCRENLTWKNAQLICLESVGHLGPIGKRIIVIFR